MGHLPSSEGQMVDEVTAARFNTRLRSGAIPL
jgi:hypothetical protein